ncbi:unnamed protein product [Ambrosiozyma monospora]|uniref:RNA helicase n=1 Tax=Ambrosiozyma monospora TaxID=43982 RepID=A0A9W6Z5D2_AMBMO|nr:unnamed protein product [Ambrosiozyma monospora]
MKVFQPVKKNQRKVILSTNIAETSVTVSGIKYVVDSGLRKVKVWRHQLGLSTLLITPISKASATQRAGRAGRESKGKCFRLFKEQDYQKLMDTTEPEILRSEIVSPVLMLKKMGVDNILDWYWLENPGVDSLKAALQQLFALGALDNAGKVNSLGDKMAILPVAPHLAAVLIQAYEYGVISPVVDIVSCLSVDNLLLTPSSEQRDQINSNRRDTCALGSKHGDLLMMKELFDLFNSFAGTQEQKKWCRDLGVSYKGMKNVGRIRRQLREYMNNLVKRDTENPEKNFTIFEDEDEDEESGVKYNQPVDPEKIIKSFLKGFITNTAIGFPDRSYRTVTNGELVSIHPSSLLFGTKKDGIMYIEYVYTTKGYARNVTAIDMAWLQEVAPHLTAKINVTE